MVTGSGCARVFSTLLLAEGTMREPAAVEADDF